MNVVAAMPKRGQKNEAVERPKQDDIKLSAHGVAQECLKLGAVSFTAAFLIFDLP
jgi:hypothetical protein